MSPNKHPLKSSKSEINHLEVNRSDSPERSRSALQWRSLPYKKSRLTALLCLTIGTLLSQPRWLFSIAIRFKPGALYRVEQPTTTSPSQPPPKVIALTIDDGPSPATGDILAVLDRYGVKATFLTISEHIPAHEQLFTQTIAAGHEIGNHLTTDDPSIRLSPKDFEADLLAAEETLLFYFSTDKKQALKGASLDQPPLQWLRPGMGFYNAQMVKTAERQGYKLVLGSVFPYDTHMPFSQFASAFILSTVKPGDIIVLHDGEGIEDGCSIENGGRFRCGRGQRTAETLARILPALQTRGYIITTVTDLMNTSQP